MLRKNSLMIVFLCSIFFFSCGVLITHFWLEPLPTIYKFYSTLKDKYDYDKIIKKEKFKKIKVDNTYFYDKNIRNEIANINKIYNSLDVIKTRESIIKDYILPDSIVNIKFHKDQLIGCYEDSNIIETNFYGIKQRGVLKKGNEEKNKNLIIYFQGHGGDPCGEYFERMKSEYYEKIKTTFTDLNYDFLTFPMFGLGINSFDSLSFPLKLPSHENSYLYENYDESSLKLLSHSIIRFFQDDSHPHIKPLSIFLSSPYYIINKIIKNGDYKKIHIMGISGGAWYSTILSALIPEINFLYSFNGTLPFFYRIETDAIGDYEMVDADLWKDYDYYTFYFLSLFDKTGQLNRTSYHVYSEYDQCCYSTPEINYFKKSLDTLEIENFHIKIFKNNYDHKINTNWISEKIKYHDLEK